MPIEYAPSPIQELLARVYRNYLALMSVPASEGAPGLGGKLVYAGELDADGKELTIAGNIAGAATLAGTADQASSRLAMHDGAVDFVVTTLDEALRILKNQIRKRERASVCVSVTSAQVEKEMLERGVRPDLLRMAAMPGAIDQFVAQGARKVEAQPLAYGLSLFAFEIPQAMTRRTGELEQALAASVAANDEVNRRWLRESPRYLGRSARRVRSVACDAEASSRLKGRLEAMF